MPRLDADSHKSIPEKAVCSAEEGRQMNIIETLKIMVQEEADSQADYEAHIYPQRPHRYARPVRWKGSGKAYYSDKGEISLLGIRGPCGFPCLNDVICDWELISPDDLAKEREI
jgi:hypothetical protein